MSNSTNACTDSSVKLHIEFLDRIFAGYADIDFSVRLWDGTVWGETARPQFTLVLNHPGALRKMFAAMSELSFGEAFVNDDFDVEGNLFSVFRVADFLLAREYSLTEKVRLGKMLASIPATVVSRSGRPAAGLRGALHSQERDRHAVTYHYDVSNDFYSLWLDRSMVYSCAYFKSPETDLDTAQSDKLDYICRKLRLRPGDRLLDLGCGWGGLLLHAARNYGVDALGITLSVPQAELARERVRAAGLADHCKIEVCDYRDLDNRQQFDKLVSVGMFEHVGEEQLPVYFERAWRLLCPGGVFLNHGIAASSNFVRKGPSFIDKYVFPDGELVPLHTAVRTAQMAGFEVRDVENLREHYALTLRAWVRRLEDNVEKARNVASDSMYRIWRLYMSGSAHGLDTGRLELHQVLLSKPDCGLSGLPLTRTDWYM